jgi:predicted phage terminase large subunit-like protein
MESAGASLGDAGGGASILREERKATVAYGIGAMRRMELCRRAHDDLLTFAQVTSADPGAPDDMTRSRYRIGRHHRLIASTLMAIELGLENRVIISIPPRHGKSELTSRKFIAWTIGRNPDQSVIFGTYNEEFALDFGRDVRSIMMQPVYKQIFPDAVLQTGSMASNRLQMTRGGTLFFVGRGGSVVGRGGHKLILDDPIKDRQEADSKVIRESLWHWFTDVFMTRLMDAYGAIVIILTRWHEDDLVGRLTDPRNAAYDETLARQWKVINIPALAEEDDILERAPGEALWPERFTVDYLTDMRKLNPESFASIWQGRPAPESGAFFTRDCIVPYKKNELPDNLRLYGASDHATSSDQKNDKTCMGLVGVDPSGDVWVLPDLFWRRASTLQTVEAMLTYFQRQPLLWWAEKDQIFRSIGPFLRQRMQESGIYASIHEITVHKDKVARAQPIRSRMAMGKVHLPVFASWYGDAVHELMVFNHGLNDDFVDFMSLIGRGLHLQYHAEWKSTDRDTGPKPGTFGYLKAQSRRTLQRERARRFGGM